MSSTDSQMRIRLPTPLKDWIVSEAENQHRTLNAQIVHSLEQVRLSATAGHTGERPAAEEASRA